MSILIQSIPDEAAFEAYKQARNAPRDTIRYGTRPNAVKALGEYDWLTAALAGGNAELGIPDMSAYATYHANAVSQVAPFIALMYKCMEILVDTPALINQAARAQSLYPPFGEEITDTINLAEYAQLLGATVAAIQNVVIAAQNMGE